MAHKNKMQKYSVDATTQNELSLMRRLKSRLEKDEISAVWNANKYSILTVNELGSTVLESSARISKFYAPTDSEHKFNKTEIKNWLPMGHNLGSSWLVTRSHNRYTMMNGNNLQVLHTHP